MGRAGAGHRARRASVRGTEVYAEACLRTHEIPYAIAGSDLTVLRIIHAREDRSPARTNVAVRYRDNAMQHRCIAAIISG